VGIASLAAREAPALALGTRSNEGVGVKSSPLLFIKFKNRRRGGFLVGSLDNCIYRVIQLGMKVSREPIEFEWDSGNIDKNLIKHRVRDEECEEVFFDPGKRMLRDVVHSANEERHILIGKTKGQRALFIIFTVRKKKVRVISARDLSKKELRAY